MRRTTVSFNSVVATSKRHKTRLLSSFERVVTRGIFLKGPEVRAFERRIRSFLGSGHVIATASGHDAIIISLLALGVKKTDEVIFPVNAYPTAFPIALSGATPVAVDVDQNGQLDVQALTKAITPHTRVVVVVHLYGLVGELQKIKALCHKHRILLLEDAAQAFGTRYVGRWVGTIGEIGCFSFYPTKNLGALGDGGAIWTQNKRLERTIRSYASYGEKRRYDSHVLAGHSRLPELQAAGLLVYLSSYQKEANARKKAARWYHTLWKTHHLETVGDLLMSSPDSDPVQHLMVARLPLRDKLQLFLAKHGIPTHIHFPIPVHRLRAFRHFPYVTGDFPQAELQSRRILSLPFHSSLTKHDVAYIVGHIREFFQNRKEP